ncbi:uncharacterized protein FIBRA_04068 [Fibroporia radiculosa]|uniref:Uncharacterized protein n=1 Tax=Fibroporia radiculosa TaxID=599839 RepID=J4H2R7_9APHY|nr:uncharacterized protein FIBRA_04068 [Fibroporia radiculosa]CCM01994.1 predicted protein [Fibroporia radiculosa]
MARWDAQLRTGTSPVRTVIDALVDKATYVHRRHLTSVKFWPSLSAPPPHVVISIRQPRALKCHSDITLVNAGGRRYQKNHIPTYEEASPERFPTYQITMHGYTPEDKARERCPSVELAASMSASLPAVEGLSISGDEGLTASLPGDF